MTPAAAKKKGTWNAHRNRVDKTRITPSPGAKLIIHFDKDFARCECSVHRYVHVLCITVERLDDGKVRCLNCGDEFIPMLEKDR